MADISETMSPIEVSFGDIVTGLIAFGAIGIAYLSYRQSIDDINSAIGLGEAAEREKAETERELRREAERHAEQLAISLENQEFANQALRKSEQNFQHAALHDSLTKLPNRNYLGDMLRGLISEYKDDPTKQFYVLFLDIHLALRTSMTVSATLLASRSLRSRQKDLSVC